MNEKAADVMRAWLARNPDATPEMITRMANLITYRYGEASAALACEMYDATALAQGAAVAAAEPAAIASYADTAKMVNAILRDGGDIPDAVGRQVILFFDKKL